MFNMEPKSAKETSWVDHMYQKFGVIYKGVDDNKFFKETSKFVECQVQTVGVNLQTFCAEIVQEFLTPSSEHPVKGPLTDLSLNYGEDISNYGKVKEGLEEFSPLVEGMPEPTKHVASAGVVKEQPAVSSVDAVRVATAGGTYDSPKSRPLPQPKDLQCQHKANRNLNEADACSKRCPDPSPSSILLTEKATSQEIAWEPVVTSLPAEAEIRTFSTQTQPMDIVYDIIGQQEQSRQSQDIFLSASSGFSIVSKDVESDESTKRVGACNLLNVEASQNEKRRTGSCGKVSVAASHFSVSSYKKFKDTVIHQAQQVEDDEYEQVVYWYREIDSEMKHSKAISPVNQIHDSCVGKFGSTESCESEWELL